CAPALAWFAAAVDVRTADIQSPRPVVIAVRYGCASARPALLRDGSRRAPFHPRSRAAAHLPAFALQAIATPRATSWIPAVRARSTHGRVEQRGRGAAAAST